MKKLIGIILNAEVTARHAGLPRMRSARDLIARKYSNDWSASQDSSDGIRDAFAKGNTDTYDHCSDRLNVKKKALSFMARGFLCSNALLEQTNCCFPIILRLCDRRVLCNIVCRLIVSDASLANSCFDGNLLTESVSTDLDPVS